MLEWAETEYPDSALFLYFKSRILRLQVSRVVLLFQLQLQLHTKNINYCVRGGHKPARWSWPTSPMPYTCPVVIPDHLTKFHCSCAETATFLLPKKIWRQHHFANHDFVQKW